MNKKTLPSDTTEAECEIEKAFQQLKKKLTADGNQYAGMLKEDWRTTIRYLYHQWLKARNTASDWKTRKYSTNERMIQVYDRKLKRTVLMRTDEANERRRIAMTAKTTEDAKNLSLFTSRLLASIAQTKEAKEITENFRKSLIQ